MLLSDERLNQIRQRWEENMPERAEVLPMTQTEGMGGANDVSYPEPGTSGLDVWPCRSKAAAAPAEAVSGGQQEAKVWWTVQLPVRSRVNPCDRLYVTGRDASGTTWSRLLEVVGPTGPRTWEAVREVLCWEILPAGAVVV